jgi:hypothetical protein
MEPFDAARLIRPMSKRGTNVLHQWLATTVPEAVGADVISVAELTQKLFADAKAFGISSMEIEGRYRQRLRSNLGRHSAS